MRRMLTNLAKFALFIGVIQAAAQAPSTIPVTGNLTQLTGSPQAYGGVIIQLQNCPSPVAISGYFGIVAQTLNLQANASGQVNSTIWPNDVITCNATTGASMYAVTLVVGGVPSGTTQCYQVVSTQGVWNLNGPQQPIACAQTPPNPQDANYRNGTFTGFFQGGAGDFANQLEVGTLKDDALNGNVGNCVQIGLGGLLAATTLPCGTSTTGVQQLIAGANITLTPSSGLGVVTVAANGGSGTVNSGTAGQLAYYAANGTAVSGETTIPVANGGTGAATAAAAAVNLSVTPSLSSPGIPFSTGSGTSRNAASADLTALYGSAPLLTVNNLSDVGAVTALKNLFFGAGLDPCPLLATDSLGDPFCVQIGTGVQITPAGGGVVVSVSYSSTSALFATNGTNYTLTFTGGAGTGAAGYATAVNCGLRTPCSLQITLTSGGSGYTSAPAVTSTALSPYYTFTATIGGSALLGTSNVIPQVATPTVGHATCVKAAGPPVLIGYCSTQPDVSGLCTCN